MFWSNGYSLVGSSPDKWRRTISHLVRDLPGVMRDTNSSFVAVQGTSGLAAAFALREYLEDNVRFVIVRKPDEKAHSGDLVAIGESFEPVVPRFVFLDDLVDSGATAVRVATALWDYECAAIVTYNGSGDNIVPNGTYQRSLYRTVSKWDEETAMNYTVDEDKQLAARRFTYNPY